MHRFVPVVTVLGLLMMVGRSRAVAPQIKDEGKFFSPDVVKKVDESIRRLAQRTAFDIFVETMNTLPGEAAGKLKQMSSMEREAFYSKFAKERAANAAVQGIYLLVTREPTHLQIEVRRGPRQSIRFTRSDLNELRTMLIRDFRAKKFDEGLENAVKFVTEKLMPNANKSGSSASSSPR